MHELFLSDGHWQHWDMTTGAGVTPANSGLRAYVSGGPRMFYAGVDWSNGTWAHFDL